MPSEDHDRYLWTGWRECFTGSTFCQEHLVLRKDVTGQYLIKSHFFLLLESGAHRPLHRAEDEDGFMYRYRHPRSPEREQLGDERKGG